MHAGIEADTISRWASCAITVPVASLDAQASLGFAAACSPWPAAPRPMVDGPGFFDRPFPDDRRRLAGRPDLSGFHTDEVSLVADYALEAESPDGFGLQSPLYIRFDGDLRTSLLPTPERLHPPRIDGIPGGCRPGQSRPGAPGAPILGLSGDRDALAAEPACWPWHPHGGRPSGRPHSTPSCFIAHCGAARRLCRRSMPGHLDHALYEPLHELLFEWRMSSEEVGYAVVFTTQDATTDLARIVHRQRPVSTPPCSPKSWSVGTKAMDMPRMPAALECPGGSMAKPPT